MARTASYHLYTHTRRRIARAKGGTPDFQSFADADTEELFRAEKNRRFSAMARVALGKLVQMNRAVLLSDLAVPPGNRLEASRATGSAGIPSASTISGA